MTSSEVAPRGDAISPRLWQGMSQPNSSFRPLPTMEKDGETRIYCQEMSQKFVASGMFDRMSMIKNQ